jgi:hypothetical protein
MEHASAAAVIVGLLFAGQCWLTIWSRNPGWQRHLAVVLCLVSIPIVGAAALSALSWPRPMWAMYGLHGNLHILKAKLIQDVGIYIWIDRDGEPQSVKLPWDNEMADKLQKLMNDPNNKGEAMMMVPGEFSFDTHPPVFGNMPEPLIEMPKEEEGAVPHLEL